MQSSEANTPQNGGAGQNQSGELLRPTGRSRVDGKETIVLMPIKCRYQSLGAAQRAWLGNIPFRLVNGAKGAIAISKSDVPKGTYMIIHYCSGASTWRFRA